MKITEEMMDWLCSDEGVAMSTLLFSDRVKHMHINNLIETNDLTIQQKLEEALNFIIPNKKKK